MTMTNVCFAETNGKLGHMTGRSTTTEKTIPEIRTRSDGTPSTVCECDCAPTLH